MTQEEREINKLSKEQQGAMAEYALAGWHFEVIIVRGIVVGWLATKTGEHGHAGKTLPDVILKLRIFVRLT